MRNTAHKHTFNIVSSFKHLNMKCTIDRRYAHTHHTSQHTQHSNSKLTVQAIAV